MKTLTKDNFRAAIAAFAEGQDEDKDEHYASDAVLAKHYLTEFYNEYFEIEGILRTIASVKGIWFRFPVFSPDMLIFHKIFIFKFMKAKFQEFIMELLKSHRYLILLFKYLKLLSHIFEVVIYRCFTWSF